MCKAAGINADKINDINDTLFVNTQEVHRLLACELGVCAGMRARSGTGD